MDLGYNKKLILEDGSEYYGYGFGSDKEHVTEIVFNTSPVGYQEIVSDPSYTYQTVVMSYPMIGNYGINNDDFETTIPTIGGLVVREYNDRPSNFRSCKTLSELMEQFDIPGISGIDTRKLSRSIRDSGSRKALITDVSTSLEEAMNIIKSTIPVEAALEEYADKEKIENTIKTMPNYFEEYDTTVNFISEKEFNENHEKMPHGGFVLRSGKTGNEKENNHIIEYSLKLDSNPEFTGSALVAFARACYRMYQEGQTGCRTVFDIAPNYLSSKSPEELRAVLL